MSGAWQALGANVYPGRPGRGATPGHRTRKGTA